VRRRHPPPPARAGRPGKRLRGELATTILESLPGVVCVADDAGRLVRWSRRAEEVWGYTPKELRVLGVLELFPAEERGRVSAVLQEVFRAGSAAMEASVMTKAGERRQFFFTGRRAKCQGKSCVVGIGLDTTDRRRAQDEEIRLRKALTHAASEWRQTFDAMEAGILILDGEGLLVRLNLAAMEWAGRPFEECLGRRLEGLGAGEPWAAAAAMVSEMRGQRAAFRQVRNARGGRSWDLAATTMATDAEDTRLLLLIRDVTSIVNLQEAARQAAHMAAMGTLTAGVAHEVRNPLFAISANVDALEMVLDGRPDVAELVAAVKDQVRRLGGLMVDLLELGRPSTATLVEGRLDRVVDGAIRGCAALAGRAGVRIEARAAGPVPPVLVDPDRLTQVLDNLLKNAIQHSPRGGVVAVELAGFREDERDWVRCTVLDEGPGFRAEDLPRVFDPFFTRRRGGTGLGLSIAQRIVEQHAGRVRAGNREEGGAAVSVDLPRSPAGPGGVEPAGEGTSR